MPPLDKAGCDAQLLAIVHCTILTVCLITTGRAWCDVAHLPSARSAVHCMQTTEGVSGLVLECLHERTIHMRALYDDGQLQVGKLSWSGCDRVWSYGMSEPGHVFDAHSYAAAQQLAQVPV
jgi:hypothetical protein